MATSGAENASVIIAAAGLLLANASRIDKQRRNARADLLAEAAEVERKTRESRAQAEQVHAYLAPNPDPFWVMVTKNDSRAPVSAVGRCFVDKRYPSRSYGYVEDLESLPAGESVMLKAPTIYLDKHIAVWLSFRDAADRWWVQERPGVLVGPLSTKPSRPPWYATDKLRAESATASPPRATTKRRRLVLGGLI